MTHPQDLRDNPKRFCHPFGDWSPAQLAHAVGARIDLRSRNNGQRLPWLLFPSGREVLTSHEHASRLLSKMARRLGIDPGQPPSWHPRALVNGREQTP